MTLAVVSQFEPFTCPQCKFEIDDEKMHGWLRTGRWAHGKAEIVPCPLCTEPARARHKIAVIEHLLGGANIPVRMHAWSFATTPGTVDPQIVERCKYFAEGNEHGLYLYGDFAVGKTGLAISIIQAAMQREEDAVFIRSLDLLDRLRQAIARGNDEGDQLLHLVKTVTWLALDDLATERPTDFVIEKLQSVLEARRDAGLYTVITSNLHLRELEAHWRPLDQATHKPLPAGTYHAGRRVLERLAEYCTSLQIKGRNIRQKPDEGKIKPIRGN